MAYRGFPSREVFEQFMRDVQLVADLLLLPNKKIENVDINGDGKIEGFKFDLGNPLYTAQPMSAIRDLAISIDGIKIEPEKISLILRKNKMCLKDVPTLPELWWGYGEVISVFIEKEGGLAPGEHQLECTLTINPAFYTFYPENTVMPTKATMVVE